jgi:hypothetical protein
MDIAGEEAADSRNAVHARYTLSSIAPLRPSARRRSKLIEFLKLPLNIGELALREMLERTCCGVYRNYLARAERVDEILKSEDTLEMSAPMRVLPVMDHRQSDSPNR